MLSKTHDRKTSENQSKLVAYHFANRVNVFSRYQKTNEEKEKLKRRKAEHKKALVQFYGENYNRRKTRNPPIHTYEINRNS